MWLLTKVESISGGRVPAMAFCHGEALYLLQESRSTEAVNDRP